MSDGARVGVSVVVPVYGCAACLDDLRRRVAHALDSSRISYDIVFVDDSSRDGASAVLARLAAEHPAVRVITLATNQGQHAAIAAGIAAATGQHVAVMDCDLQDPPELLPRMLAALSSSVDAVVGRRVASGDAWWRRMGTRAFGVLARRRHQSRLIGTHSVFSVLTRRAVEEYLGRDDRRLMYLPVLESAGLRIHSFDYDRASRHAGTSAYGIAGLMRRAWRVLTAPRQGRRIS